MRSDPPGRQSGDKARPKAAAHGRGALPPISRHPRVCPTQVLAEGRGQKTEVSRGLRGDSRSLLRGCSKVPTQRADTEPEPGHRDS